MKICVINPNSTQSMTDKILEAALAVAPNGLEVVAKTCTGSPPAIENEADKAAAVPGVVAAAKAAALEGAQACVVACFDDPGLMEARAAAGLPIVGIGEAAFHAAHLLGKPWAVVTTTPEAIEGMMENIRSYGLDARCCGVRASGIRVLDLEDPASGAVGKVSAEIGRAISEDGVGVVAMGCAGMADLGPEFSQTHGIAMIDGVAAALQMAQLLARIPGAMAPASA